MSPRIWPIDLLRQTIFTEHVVAGDKSTHAPLWLEANATFRIHHSRKDVQIESLRDRRSANRYVHNRLSIM